MSNSVGEKKVCLNCIPDRHLVDALRDSAAPVSCQYCEVNGTDGVCLSLLKEEALAGRPLDKQQQAALSELGAKEPHIGPLAAKLPRRGRS